MKNIFALIGCCCISAAVFATPHFSDSTPGKRLTAVVALCNTTAPATISHTVPTEPNLVDICHKGHLISVDAHAVPAHLAHGDKMGSCAGGPARGSR